MSQRLDTHRAIETFRANHRDPRNLALHLVGYWFLFRALKRLFTGHFFAALTNAGIGLGILVGGHRIEGSESFALLKQRRELIGNGQPARI